MYVPCFPHTFYDYCNFVTFYFYILISHSFGRRNIHMHNSQCCNLIANHGSAHILSMPFCFVAGSRRRIFFSHDFRAQFKWMWMTRVSGVTYLCHKKTFSFVILAIRLTLLDEIMIGYRGIIASCAAFDW